MIANWLSQNRQALLLVVGRLWRARLATLMMVGVMGVALCLPALLYVSIGNAQRLTSDIQGAPQISLFLTLDASSDTRKSLDKQLRAHAEISSFRFVGRDAAWQELKQNSGLEEIASGMEQNPLPDAYIIHAKSNDPAVLERLQHEMQQWAGVEHVQLEAAWIKRLHGFLELGRKAVAVIAGLLGFALIAIIGNTIRLQILTQREEIEVSRLIGATSRFIRRPFLYAGALYGLIGGIGAWLMLAATLWLFNQSVADLAKLYASDFHLLMPAPDFTLTLVGGSTLLGWLGSFLAVNRALSEIDPA